MSIAYALSLAQIIKCFNMDIHSHITKLNYPKIRNIVGQRFTCKKLLVVENFDNLRRE